MRKGDVARPPQFLVSGWYGFGNLGDEVILHAIRQALEQAAPGCEVRALSYRPEHTRRYLGLEAAHQLPFGWREWAGGLLRGRLGGTFKALWRCDVLLLGGGGFLSDWQPEAPWCWLRQALLARLLGKKVQLYGIGAGPFNRRWGRWITRTLIRLAVDVITVRDEGSKSWLERAGVPAHRIHLTADPVFGLEGGAGADRQEAPAVVGLAIAPVFHLEDLWPGQAHRYRDYVQALAATCRALAAQGHELWFLPMQEDVDRKVFQDLDALLPGVVSYRALPGDVEGAIRELGRPDALVAMRLHAGILAALQGVPPVGIIYHPKVAAFLDRIGLRHFAEELGDGSNWPEAGLDAARLVRSVETTLADRPALQQEMALRLEPLRSAALANARMAAELVGRP
jgi:polysaccharide pyruvyl transferase CsaB